MLGIRKRRIFFYRRVRSRIRIRINMIFRITQGIDRRVSNHRVRV